MSVRRIITVAMCALSVIAASFANPASATNQRDSVAPTATIATGIHQPGIAAVAGTQLWVPGRDTNTVVVIDAATNTVKATLKARGYGFATPGQVIDLGGTAAVINAGTSSITLINETTFGVVRIISAASTQLSSPGVGAYAGGGLWVPERLSNTVVDINWHNGKVIRTLHGASTGLSSPQFAVANGRFMFIVNQHANTITEVDGATGIIIKQLRSPNYHLVAANLFGLPTLIGTNLWLPLHLTNGRSLVVCVAIATGAVTATINDATTGLAYPITAAGVGQNIVVVNPVKLPTVATVSANIATGVGDVAAIHATGGGHLPTKADVLAAISLLAPSVTEAQISLSSVTFTKGTGLMDLHLTFSQSSYDNGATFVYPACATVPANATTTASTGVRCPSSDPVPALPDPPGNSLSVFDAATASLVATVPASAGTFDAPRSLAVIGATAYITCANGTVVATDPSLGIPAK